MLNGLLVFGGYSEWPIVSLMLGLLGAGAIVTLAALLAQMRLFHALRYCGEHSIVIYLAFFIFMAGTRMFLFKTGLVPGIGLISTIVTLAGVIGPLMLFWLVRGTPLRFLFERPDALARAQAADGHCSRRNDLYPHPEERLKAAITASALQMRMRGRAPQDEADNKCG